MDQQITVREWVAKWNAGEFAAADFQTQVKAGWYDWFCNDRALAGRLVKFGRMLAKVKNDFLLDNYRVWFKNNCPMVGPLYDDIRFEPIDESLRETHYFGIAADDKRRGAKYTVFTARSGYEDEAHLKTAREVEKFLNDWKA